MSQMNALISGSAGKGLLMDDVSWESIGIRQAESSKPAGATALSLLFGESKDLRFIEGIDKHEALEQLKNECERADALDVGLILLARC